MKKIAHFFSEDTILTYLDVIDTAGITNSDRSEFVFALITLRMLQKDWGSKASIGFYLTQKYQVLLEEKKDPSWELYSDIFMNGLEKYDPIDFMILEEGDSENKGCQFFQLKTYGFHEEKNDTDGLATYLNSMYKKYAFEESTFLVALNDAESYDFLDLKQKVNQEKFPFKELAFITCSKNTGEMLKVVLFPNEGFDVYDYKEILNFKSQLSDKNTLYIHFSDDTKDIGEALDNLLNSIKVKNL